MLARVPPDSEIPRDGWLRATRWVLIGVGILYLPMIALGPFLAASQFNDPKMPAEFNRTFGLAFTVLMAAVCVGAAVLNFVAAWGLARFRKWAWILGLLLGGTYAASACLPFGAVILYGLLREKARALYLGKPAVIT
jgi:hypothetical protein